MSFAGFLDGCGEIDAGVVDTLRRLPGALARLDDLSPALALSPLDERNGRFFAIARGDRLAAAGYVLPGAKTVVFLTLGRGVHGFTREGDELVATHPEVRIPDTGRTIAVDTLHARTWPPALRAHLEPCLRGDHAVQLRWSGSLVAEIHHILLRGGIYLDAEPESRVDLAAAAFLVEQAGGAAVTQAALALGSRLDVARTLKALDDGGPAYRSPFFGHRSLFSDR